MNFSNIPLVTGCLLFLVGCLYQTASFLSLYFQYPTAVEINVIQAPLLNFPAVTICNGNRVNQRLWCISNPNVCKKNEEETEEAFSLRLQLIYTFLNKSTRVGLGHRKEDFIHSCRFEGEDCLNLTSQYFNYEYTNCFTVNGQWSNSSLSPLVANMFRPRSGTSSELYLQLNLETKDNSPMTPLVRARMTIHSPSTIPHPQYDGVSLQPGNTYSYGVRENVLNVLRHPYVTNCKNYSGLVEQKTGSTLTQEACMTECCARLHVEQCGCSVHRLSLLYDLRTCTHIHEEQCLINSDKEIKQQCYHKCRMPCSKTTYDYISVDSFSLHAGDCSRKFDNNTYSHVDRSSFVCLKVFYASADSEVYSQRPKYNGIQVFSIIGGYMGLWLGVSLLTILDYITNRLRSCCHKKTKKKRAKKNSKRGKVINIIHYPQ